MSCCIAELWNAPAIIYHSSYPTLLFPVSVGLSRCVILVPPQSLMCGLSVMGYWVAQDQGSPLSGGSPQVLEMVPGRMLGI